MKTSRSEALYAAACEVLPGGVNSPVRAFQGVGGSPLFIDHGEGATLIDVDHNRLVDYVLSWGPLILGHAYPEVVEAVQQAAARGTSYGAPTEAEIELARAVIETFPAIERVRFVNSGTEATMSALRLARAYTGRKKIIKFEGCYHGHADFLLVQAGSGVATLGLPNSPGVPPATVSDTLVSPYNNLDTVSRYFEIYDGQIAAVIVEPVAGNMGVIPAAPGFLEGLRAQTEAHGALLIFDEVMTGWRVHPAGAQVLYGIRPDLTCLGKVIGGGLPVGAYGGRAEIMDLMAPAGPVYQAGTLSGNPLAMAAGLATLRVLGKLDVWKQAAAHARQVVKTLSDAAAQAGIPLQTAQIGTMFGFFFSERPVIDFASAKASDTSRYAHFFWKMLEGGVYLAPSAFEAGFTSAVHGEAEQQIFERAARTAMAALR